MRDHYNHFNLKLSSGVYQMGPGVVVLVFVDVVLDAVVVLVATTGAPGIKTGSSHPLADWHFLQVSPRTVEEHKAHF